MSFLTIASRAMPVIRSIWGAMKKNPAFSNIKDFVIDTAIDKGSQYIDSTVKDSPFFKKIWGVMRPTIKSFRSMKKLTSIANRWNDYYSFLKVIAFDDSNISSLNNIFNKIF